MWLNILFVVILCFHFQYLSLIDLLVFIAQNGLSQKQWSFVILWQQTKTEKLSFFVHFLSKGDKS